MADRRRPVTFLAEHDPDHLIVRKDGSIRQAAMVILSEEDTGRVRAGYVCINCLEVQEESFPEKCYLCKFPMRDKQSERFAKEFSGNMKVGPSTSLDDEEAIMNEWEARRKWAELERRSSPQIMVPKIWTPGSR